MLAATAHRTPVVVAILSKKAWYGPVAGHHFTPERQPNSEISHETRSSRRDLSHRLAHSSTRVGRRPEHFLCSEQHGRVDDRVRALDPARIREQLCARRFRYCPFAGEPAADHAAICGNGCALCGLLHPIRRGYEESRPERDATLLFPVRASPRAAAAGVF
jgi:hypothetical protein